QLAIQPVAVLAVAGFVDPAGQVEADPPPLHRARQAGPVPVGLGAHETGRPVVVGEAVQRLQVEIAQCAVDVSLAAHAGDLAGIDPTGRPGGRADVHGLEGLLVEAGVDAQAVVESDLQALHAV